MTHKSFDAPSNLRRTGTNPSRAHHPVRGHSTALRGRVLNGCEAMRRVVLVMCALLLPAAAPCVAQSTANGTSGKTGQITGPERRIAIGASVGVVRPMNEAAYLNNQETSGTFDLFAFLRDGFVPGFMPEVRISRATNKSKDTVAYSAYRTHLWTLDMRLRWFPGTTEHDVVAPYGSAGLGIVIPENEFPTEISDPTFRKNTAALLFPVHVGALVRLTRSISADLQAGWMFTTSDDINPAHDGRFDGWLRGCVGLVYTLPGAAVDTDEDELSDAEERRLGTDPYRADTDVDGLSDGAEVLEYGTDPLNVDSDDGGVIDGIEATRGTSPTDVVDDILSIRPGESVALRNVVFETGQTTFPASSVTILRSLASFLQKTPTAEVLILGHTDATGDRDSNFVLSRLRAQGVRDWLLAQGISGARMTTNGLGPDNPASSNSSAEGRRRNRRIEILRTK